MHKTIAKSLALVVVGLVIEGLGGSAKVDEGLNGLRMARDVWERACERAAAKPFVEPAKPLKALYCRAWLAEPSRAATLPTTKIQRHVTCRQTTDIANT